MNRILKYDFGRLSPGIKTVTIKGELHHILDIQDQGDHLVMWASVGHSVKSQDITVDVRYTGDTEPNKTYYKTIQDDYGLVYHIYLEYPLYD